MKRSSFARGHWAFSVLLAACAPQTPPEAPAPSPSATTPTPEKPQTAQNGPLAGLTPCAKDAPEGSGCATKPQTDAATTDPGDKKQKKIDDTVWRVPIGRDDPAKGAVSALVTLVVFSDFQCPFCKNGAKVLDQVLTDLPDDARLVWKDCPLPMHDQAEPAAELARAARAKLGDTGFWSAHAMLYESQSSLGDETYRTIADKLGLPWGPTRAAIRGARYGAIIRSGVELSDRVDVPATPTTFVNGRKVVGAQPYDVVRSVVDEELAKAKDLVAKGTSRVDLYSAIVKNGKELAPITDTQAP